TGGCLSAVPNRATQRRGSPAIQRLTPDATAAPPSTARLPPSQKSFSMSITPSAQRRSPVVALPFSVVIFASFHGSSKSTVPIEVGLPVGEAQRLDREFGSGGRMVGAGGRGDEGTHHVPSQDPRHLKAPFGSTRWQPATGVTGGQNPLLDGQAGGVENTG